MMRTLTHYQVLESKRVSLIRNDPCSMEAFDDEESPG